MSTGQGLSSLIPKRNGGNAPAARPAPSEERPYFTQNFKPPAAPATPRNEERRFQPAPKPQKSGEMIYQIETEKIRPNPYQPRTEFNDGELQELAGSIREFGILQPLVVSKITKETETGADVEYQLIAGERRLRAAKIAGLERVPAIIRTVDGARHKLEMALIENIQRENLNPLEAAKAYARLQDEFGLTQREIAARVGKSREAVANTLRLLNLPGEIKEALSSGRINESQARMLLGFENVEEQRRVFRNILEGKMSVRAVRSEVEKGKAKMQDPDVGYWTKRIEENLGAPVKIAKEGGQGKIVMEFFSEEEWRSLIDKLGGSAE